MSCKCRNIAKMSTWLLDREGEKRWSWNYSTGQSCEDLPPQESMRQLWMSTFTSSMSFVTETLRSWIKCRVNRQDHGEFRREAEDSSSRPFWKLDHKYFITWETETQAQHMQPSWLCTSSDRETKLTEGFNQWGLTFIPGAGRCQEEMWVYL